MRDTLRRGSDTVPNTGGGSFTVLTLTLELAYQFPRRLGVRVRAPIHWKSFEETSPSVDEERNGLGDVELLGSYALPGRAHWHFNTIAGAALPTGATEPQPFVGEDVPTPLQLGGGTFDPVLGLSASYEPHALWTLDATAAARFALYENADDYRSASLFELGAGGAWELWDDRVRLHLRAAFSHVTHVQIAGVEAPNTGRDTVFASLGGRLRLWESATAELAARVPLYMHVNETQFAEDVLFSIRLSYTTGTLF